MAFYWQGPGTHQIPASLHAKNRKKLVEELRKNEAFVDGSFVAVAGGNAINFYSGDTEYDFKQEPFFRYLFGAKEEGCFGAIDVSTGVSTLFIPRLPKEYAMWMGEIKPPSHFKDAYEVEQVLYADEVPKFFKDAEAKKLFLLEGKNSDSGITATPASFDGIEQYTQDKTTLYPILSELRVHKEPEEVAIMSFANKVSSQAHIECMKQCKPGMKEYELESIFCNHVYREGGCRHLGYGPICGSGKNSAILHYGHAGAPNDKVINDGDMLLLDMGGEYFGYTADITISFPANGKFTEDQKLIYNAVLAASTEVENSIKPGVKWGDMHMLAERTILTHLRNGGLLVGDVEDMMSAYLGAVFMPHGLGHLIGLNVHDVGGYPAGVERINRPGINKLRTTRVLEEGMSITVEPGCYFIDFLIEEALQNEEQSKFFNKDVLARFRQFGGVRIEDNVVVTKTGMINLTEVPRRVDEIESLMHAA